MAKKKRVYSRRKPYSFSAHKTLMDDVAEDANEKNISASEWIQDAIKTKLARERKKK